MGSSNELAQARIQVIGPHTSFSKILPVGQWIAMGSGANAQLQLEDSSLAALHFSLRAREDGRVEVRPSAPTLLNEVQLGGSGIAGSGDELQAGGLRVLFSRQVSLRPASSARLANHEGLRGWLREPRRWSLVLMHLPKSPLEERVPLLSAQLEVPAQWARYGRSTLAAAFESESDEQTARAAERMGAALMGAGAPFRIGWGRALKEGDEEGVLEAAASRLLKLPVQVPPEQQVAQNAVQMRLRMAVEEDLSGSPGWVLLFGEAGVGKLSLAQSLSPQAVLLPHLDGKSSQEVETLLEGHRSRGDRVVATSSTDALPWASRFSHALHLPALRDRPDEILPLAQLFLTRAGDALGRRNLSLSPEAQHGLMACDFPGNVRQLKNWVERAALASEEEVLPLDAFPQEAAEAAPHPPSSDLRSALRSVERDVLLAALKKTRWNVTQTAKELGLPRRTVVYRMAKLGLRRPERRRSSRGQ